MFYCDMCGGRVYSGCFTVMCVVVKNKGIYSVKLIPQLMLHVDRKL